jgi:hypothetical protein
MAKADNQRPTEPASAPVLSTAQQAENAAYVENWSVKYAAQIAAHNKMIEQNGDWNDEFRVL